MTDREKMRALAEGKASEGKPVLAWPLTDESNLAQIPNPFGLAIQNGLDLNEQLARDPEAGSAVIDSLCQEVADLIDEALLEGADGIFYCLHGACAKWCTPMQYGGFFLERDRELLQRAGSAKLNVLFVVGDDEVYFDFVSDLPAAVFGWDSRTTGVSDAEIRAMWPGLTLSADPESSIELSAPKESIARLMEPTPAHV